MQLRQLLRSSPESLRKADKLRTLFRAYDGKRTGPMPESAGAGFLIMAHAIKKDIMTAIVALPPQHPLEHTAISIPHVDCGHRVFLGIGLSLHDRQAAESSSGVLNSLTHKSEKVADEVSGGVLSGRPCRTRTLRIRLGACSKYSRVQLYHSLYTYRVDPAAHLFKFSAASLRLRAHWSWQR